MLSPNVVKTLFYDQICGPFLHYLNIIDTIAGWFPPARALSLLTPGGSIRDFTVYMCRLGSSKCYIIIIIIYCRYYLLNVT